jgi:PKD repeat protein
MKKIFLILLFSVATIFSHAQTGEWVWLHGSNTTNDPGVFGVQGVSDPANKPPGIYESCEWRDATGNLWVFGGLDNSYSEYADLWKYDPVINEWTWMKGTASLNIPSNYGTMGVASPTNDPGSRAWGMASWVDNTGNFWMFGGMGSAGVLSDLWRYEPATNNWTWMKGSQGGGNTGVYGTQGVPDPANFPGARYECAAAWTDAAGDLWLFGGDFGANFRNDLWRYNIANNEWTWMKGPQTLGQASVFGTQGVEDPANVPGARAVYAHWKDNNNNFWIFGGTDFGAGTYNDLWRYNPVTNNWAWFKGTNAPGVYGTKCIGDSLTTPGSRFENRAAGTDVNGNLWLYGGGIGSSFQDVYNDLWMYCVNSNKWIWVSGDTISNQVGNWGTLGVSSPLNKPDGRGGNNMWSDQAGHLYMFGGTGDAWPSMYNDLWMYTIDPACSNCATQPSAIFSAPNHICPGTCTDFQNLSTNATSYIWSFAGANPGVSTDVNPTNICYNTPGTYTVSLIAINATGSDTLTLNNFITVFPAPPAQGILQNGDTLFANPGSTLYQWYFNGSLISGATNYFYVAPQSGNYSVIATDENNCEVEAVINNVIASSSQMAIDGLQLAINPNPVIDILEIKNLKTTEKNSFTIYNTLGSAVQLPIANCQLPTCSLDVSSLPPGIYFLEINSQATQRIRFIKSNK